MASEENRHLDVRPTTYTLALRPRANGGDTMGTATLSPAPPALTSPGISVEFHGDPSLDAGNAQTYPHPAPPDVQSFPSPMRHHRRTPSAHREIKETLNARSEYTNEDVEGYTHYRINQYVIKDEIGRGSYGAVHLATDQFGNEYAVKAFSKARLRKRAQSNILRHGPRGLGRFPRAGFGAPDVPISGFRDQQVKEANDALYLIREEVAIMKKLNHPNLVQLIEVLDDPEQDTLYMVLEMCTKGVVMKVGLGESATPYPEETCRYWFRDLILGIEYLHSQGVVHRDIKPDNLLLTDDDVLKIVDFGVSEMFERSGDMRTTKSAGSPAFLPPELCVARHGDVSGKAADIWSMGVSLYCLRYGRIPFERESILDMYEAIKRETPQLPPDENPDFVDLMGRLLEKDPEKRIKMEDLREHSWVTKGGTDSLLSAEENCSDLVDPPNPLELNHAFTRRMSHLICVMKAISKFKGLLKPRPLTRQEGIHPPEFLSAPASPAPEAKAFAAQSTAEFAARVLRERQEFLAGGGKANLDLLLRKSQATSSLTPLDTTTTSSSSSSYASSHVFSKEAQPLPPQADAHSQHPPHQQHPTAPILGIGTGGHDDFSAGPHAHAADVVSDSPTAVDFNVYDRAFDAELERIKRSTSRRGAGPPGSGRGRGAGEGAGEGQVYQTRFRERGGGGAAQVGGGRDTPRSLAVATAASGTEGGGGGGGIGRRFADVVGLALDRAGEGER